MNALCEAYGWFNPHDAKRKGKNGRIDNVFTYLMRYSFNLGNGHLIIQNLSKSHAFIASSFVMLVILV